MQLYAPLAVSAGAVTAAGSQTDNSNLLTNQREFAKKFAGLAGAARLAGDPADTDFQVLRAAMVDFDCASTTWAVGDLIAPAAATGTVLANNKMAKVTDPSAAIGYCVKAGTSLTRVRGFYFSRHVGNNLLPVIGQPAMLVSQSLAVASFTDGGSTSGYIDFTTGALPAGALVLGWMADVTGAFAGDTTATIAVGVSGSTSRFSADTAQSAFTTGKRGSASAVATAFSATSLTPRVTVTGTADFTSIVSNAGGVMTVTLFYVPLY
jgi:hypothetical protein